MVDAGVYFGGVLATNIISWEYNTSISAVTNKCVIILENGGGINTATTNHFTDIKIYSSVDVMVWRGVVYDINPKKDGTLEIIGFGYMRGLMNQFHIGTFTAEARSIIVESLVDTYGGGITTVTHITATSDSITRTFKSGSVFDGILELADEVGFDVWVDDDLEFYFVPRGTTSSGRTIVKDGGYVANSESPTEGRIIYNKVYVYGDANKDGLCETKVLVEDLQSQIDYGIKKEYPPIVDPGLQSMEECEARGQQIMDAYSTPVKILKIEVFGFNDITPGESVIISGFNAVDGLPNGTYIVLERSGTSTRGSQVLTLAQYTHGTSDTIADLIRRMRKREYTEIDATAVATNIHALYDDISLSGTIVLEKLNVGQSFITGHPVNGICGLTANNIVTGLSGTSTTTEINGADIMIVDAGLNLIRDWIAGETVVAPSHGAIGTGTTAVVAGNTTLGTEVFRDTLYGKSRPTSKQVRFTTQVTTAEGNGSTITEHGILNAASTGTLLCRHVHTGIVKNNTFELRYQVLIALADV